MSRILPERPSLEHLKKQAKDLLKALGRGDPDAVERFRAVESRTQPTRARLADAQHVLAREYGFASWVRLKAHVESGGRVAEAIERLSQAVRDEDVSEVRQILAGHPELRAPTR